MENFVRCIAITEKIEKLQFFSNSFYVKFSKDKNSYPIREKQQKN